MSMSEPGGGPVSTYLYSFENPLRELVTVNVPSSRAEIFTQ
jgi:hypothetical protein